MAGGTFQNPTSQEEINKDISNVSGVNGSNLFGVNASTHRLNELANEIDKSNDNTQVYYSARKEYFNSNNKQPHQDISLMASAKKAGPHSRNDSVTNLKPRGLDPINRDVVNASDMNHLAS